MMTANEQLAAANRRAKERAAQTPADVIAGEDDFPAPEIVAPDADSLSWEWFATTIDPETRELLGEVELRKLYNEQLQKALDEKKAVARKAVAEQAAHTAKVAMGLIPASAAEALETRRRNNRLTRIRVDLPPSGDQGEIPDIGLNIDGRIYLHGRDHTVTEGMAAFMREQMYRLGEAELLFKGQNTRQRRWLLGRAMNDPRYHIPLNPDGSRA